MTAWKLKSSDLKQYPHLDPAISATEAVALATSPERVSKHTFYPFFLFTNRWTKFADRGEKGKVKSRPIRYAARADAYIFSFYRHQLAEKYEKVLEEAEISHCVLAYRRLRTSEDEGKCNIHFARDAFETIRKIGDCTVVTLDISSFFEHIDHALLREKWCQLIGEKSLPLDHERVFRAITKFAVVEKQSVFERLGYFGEKRKDHKGLPIKGYLTPFKKIPRQLCTGKQFREKIAGGDGNKSLIKKNFKPYGIPQGSPVSDVLANLYLLDFDIALNKIVSDLGGMYVRYSDDILLIIPSDSADGLNLMDSTRSLIQKYGEKLSIKEEKCSVFVFKKKGDHQTFELVHGSQGKNGIEYLGFRYDGKKVYIRDSTLSNLYRKVARSSKAAAFHFVKRYPGKSAAYLASEFDTESLIQKFGRVQDFGEQSEDYKNWTFWTYARRASKIFGPLGRPILGQLRNHRAVVRERIVEEIHKAVRLAGK